MKIKSLFQIFALVLGSVTVHAQVLNEAWVQHYSYNGISSSDQSTKVVTDHAGNVIVAGNSNDGITGTDWLIIKYTGAGVPIWTNRFNGPETSVDAVKGMVVNSNGTIFVTGDSGLNNLSDFATIAYSDAGVPLWTNRYNGPGNNMDKTAGVALSPNGMLFVTGFCSTETGARDYATIAYTEAGVPVWTNRFNALTNGSDLATAIAVGTDGTVFVTGSSWSVSSDTDYATIAYTEAGVALWTNRYSGPGNQQYDLYDDQPNALAVGPNGKVFVTGYESGSNGDLNYATVAYSGAGVALWTNHYVGPNGGVDSPTAVAVGTDGTVFITGGSYNGIATGNDCTTIAYSDAGMPLWTNRYNAPANFGEQGNAVALGSNGTVFVTGSYQTATQTAFVTIAYTGTGIPLWTNFYTGPGNSSSVAVGPNGTVFITGPSSNDFATLAYSDTGIPLWTNRYDGPGNSEDIAASVAVGPGGTILVTGAPHTVAYTEAGLPLWTNLNGGRLLAFGPDGTSFVADSFGGKGHFYITFAISAAGVPLWTNRDGFGVNATAIGVGSNGNVYLTGSPYTTAYSGAGVRLWGADFGGTANALAVGPGGNVFVTGASSGATSYCATIAYSGTGMLLWTNRYDGPGNKSDAGNAVAVSPSGNIIVAGTSFNVGSSCDYVTIAYTEAGLPLWTNRYSGLGNSNQVTALTVDSGGTVFVAGTSYDGTGSCDYATVAYSAVGLPLWTNRYDGPAHDRDLACTVAVDSNGIVFVSGNSYNGNGISQIATVAYSAAGLPLSTNRYSNPANSGDVVASYSLAVVPDGVVVAGTSDSFPGLGKADDYALIKYTVTPGTTPPDTTNAPPPTITLLPGGDAQLTFYGVSGSSYILEHTSDLGSNSWTPVQTNTAAVNGAVPFTYLPMGPLNFWRIRPLP